MTPMLSLIHIFMETTPLDPHSPYSSSKASADLFVKAYADTYKFPVNITRCSNNYGPYQFPEKLIPLMINNTLQHKDLPIYGDGMQIRDWLYVEDHCKAIDMVARDGVVGQVYNVGGHNAVSYTHLDVYKRQFLISLVLLFCHMAVFWYVWNRFFSMALSLIHI